MVHRARISCLTVLLWPLFSPTAIAAGTAANASADTLFQAGQQFWTEEIALLGGRYRPAKLAHFTGPAKDVCAVPGTVTGSFYCPREETIYIDDAATTALMARAHGNAGAAVAFVIGHELAHHVQAIIGTTTVVQQARLRSAPEIASRTFITFELQADCYAGLWLHWAGGHGAIKAAQDLSALLTAVARAPNRAVPAGQQVLDPLDQGTAAQRLNWVGRGLGGQFNDCDTFGAAAAGKL